jgi:hypothetical protein
MGWNGNIYNPRPLGGKGTFWPRHYGGWLASSWRPDTVDLVIFYGPPLACGIVL